MTGSLLGRIARHPRRPGRDEHEDRLTEVFAAVLDHPDCSGLSQFMVAGWLQLELKKAVAVDRDRLERLRQDLTEGDWQCEVRTQVFTTVEQQNRRPDLELRLTQRGRRDVLICVEVKHGTAPHTQQLQAYVDAQSQRASTDTVVLLLAPRDAYPFAENEIPDSVPQLRWQDTAAMLRTYQPRTEAAEFLVNELQSYLKEEGLMDPDRVTPEHLVALAHYKEALAALELVCEQADGYVTEAWAHPDPDYTASWGGETWWDYPASPDGPSVVGDWTFAWHLFIDSSRIFRDGRVGVPRFAAGVRTTRGQLAATLKDAAADELRKAGFELFEKGDVKHGSWDAVWRLAYPEDVLAGASIQAQGRWLGRWIVESFELARAALAQN